MAVFGQFETIGRPWFMSGRHGRIRSSWRATRQGVNDGRVYFIKSIALPAGGAAPESASTEQPIVDPCPDFFESIRRLQEAHRASPDLIAPIFDAGKTGTDIWYATEVYPRHSLAEFHSSDQEIDDKTLKHIVHSIASGCAAFQRATGRSHGNLKAGNVLLAGESGSLARTPLHLIDPAGTTAAHSQDSLGKDLRTATERSDLRRIGEIILELVEQKVIDGPEDYKLPIQHSSKWEVLGKHSERWLALCNRLLSPALSLDDINLESLAKDLRPGSIKKVVFLTGLGLLAMVAIASYLAWAGLLGHAPRTWARELKSGGWPKLVGQNISPVSVGKSTPPAQDARSKGSDSTAEAGTASRRAAPVSPKSQSVMDPVESRRQIRRDPINSVRPAPDAGRGVSGEPRAAHEPTPRAFTSSQSENKNHTQTAKVSPAKSVPTMSASNTTSKVMQASASGGPVGEPSGAVVPLADNGTAHQPASRPGAAMAPANGSSTPAHATNSSQDALNSIGSPLQPAAPGPLIAQSGIAPPPLAESMTSLSATAALTPADLEARAGVIESELARIDSLSDADNPDGSTAEETAVPTESRSSPRLSTANSDRTDLKARQSLSMSRISRPALPSRSSALPDQPKADPGKSEADDKQAVAELKPTLRSSSQERDRERTTLPSPEKRASASPPGIVDFEPTLRSSSPEQERERTPPQVPEKQVALVERPRFPRASELSAKGARTPLEPVRRGPDREPGTSKSEITKIPASSSVADLDELLHELEAKVASVVALRRNSELFTSLDHLEAQYAKVNQLSTNTKKRLDMLRQNMVKKLPGPPPGKPPIEPYVPPVVGKDQSSSAD